MAQLMGSILVNLFNSICLGILTLSLFVLYSLSLSLFLAPFLLSPSLLLFLSAWLFFLKSRESLTLQGPSQAPVPGAI